MKKQLHLSEHIWEAMEACRWGAADTDDPAMAHLTAEMAAKPELEIIFDHIERLDGKISTAFQDVSVPPGLAQRVLDHLFPARIAVPASNVLKPEPDQPANINAAPMASSFPAQGKRKVLRRCYLASGGLLSAALLLFLALWLNSHNAQTYTEQSVFDEAIRFFESDSLDGRIPLAEKSPPKTFPFSRAVFFSKGVCWRHIRDFLGQAGLAYDLPNPDGRRATLYVVRQNVEALGNVPQYHPFTTGGFSASAWQEDGLLYVLVVQGEPNTYQKYLNLPRGPVA